MKILVVGEAHSLEECKTKCGNDHTYFWVDDHNEVEDAIENIDVIFDFIIDEDPHAFDIYADRNIAVFLNTAKISLREIVHLSGNSQEGSVFGFNGLPTFFDRNIMEVSSRNNKNLETLGKICDRLGTKYQLVDDRVGLVTPRVIVMIINEAYYTVQEGTASRKDIDLAMKLGTNYPYGPFEWCQRIGVNHIYETLEAIYEDTKDERYKICPLLKKEYLDYTG